MLHDKINLDCLEVLNDAIIIVLFSRKFNGRGDGVDRFSKIVPRPMSFFLNRSGFSIKPEEYWPFEL